jgi:hypothetical protein
MLNKGNALLVLTAVIWTFFTARDGCTQEGKAIAPGLNPSVSAKVAPIFNHGKGRIKGSNPQFLTEEEARKVICEEAAKAGIHFENSKQIIPLVERPVTNGYEPATDARIRKPKVKADSLELDGADVSRNISFEFISVQDIERWQVETARDSEVEKEISEKMRPKDSIILIDTNPQLPDYATKQIAEMLQYGLLKTKLDQLIVIFYDPGNKINQSLPDSESKIKALDELRQQVRDFIEWLKKQR